MNSKEAVVEEVLRRIAEEHGVEAMALDWSILQEALSPEEKSIERDTIKRHHRAMMALATGIGGAAAFNAAKFMTHPETTKLKKKIYRYTREQGKGKDRARSRVKHVYRKHIGQHIISGVAPIPVLYGLGSVTGRLHAWSKISKMRKANK